MITENEKKIKHVAWVIAGGFFSSALAYLLSMFFIPDINAEMPVVSPVIMTLGQIQTALYILGCTGLGIKLAEEKKTIPSIGFTMMSIAQGVLYVIFLISINSNENMDEVYKLFSASLYLLVPSMILIAFYSEFPRWVNIAGLAACIPAITENIFFAMSKKFSGTILIIDGIGQLLFNIVAIAWGFYVLRNAKREILANRKIESG